MRVTVRTPYGTNEFWRFTNAKRARRAFVDCEPPFSAYGPLSGGWYGVTDGKYGNVLSHASGLTGICTRDVARRISRAWNG